MLLRKNAIKRSFVFPPQITGVSALPGEHEHINAKNVPFKCGINSLPKLSHLLLDFFNTADLQLIFTMLYDSINLVM